MDEQLESLSVDEAADQMVEIMDKDEQEQQAPDTGIDKNDNADGEGIQEGEADSEEEAEFIEWGEGDDAKQVKLDDLIKGYEASQVEPDYSTMPEYQQALQTTQQQAQQYQQTVGQLGEFANHMQQQFEGFAALAHPGEEPLRSEYPQDSEGQYFYNVVHENWRRKNAEYVQLSQQMQQNVQAVRMQQQQAVQEYQRQQYDSLVKAWPEWSDVGVQQKAYTLLSDYGFQPEELQSITDSRFHLVLKDLMELKAGKAEASKATQKIISKGAPKRVKPRRADNTGNNSALDRLRAKGEKTGLSPDEATLLMMGEA